MLQKSGYVTTFTAVWFTKKIANNFNKKWKRLQQKPHPNTTQNPYVCKQCKWLSNN
jgi:hypothetical protein